MGTLLNAHQAAAYLSKLCPGVGFESQPWGWRKVLTLAAGGRLPVLAVGRRRYFRAEELADWARVPRNHCSAQVPHNPARGRSGRRS